LWFWVVLVLCKPQALNVQASKQAADLVQRFTTHNPVAHVLFWKRNSAQMRVGKLTPRLRLSPGHRVTHLQQRGCRPATYNMRSMQVEQMKHTAAGLQACNRNMD
jgi:hypothetical protein